ncbi:MAG: tetratricopeptide repeat protein, partial [Azonexus sp.]|nr:tetratricopeptide repeat protein [Azonexus sp.]
MAMNHKPLLQQRFRTLSAIAFGLMIGFSAPVFADNLPEIQRLIKQGQYPQALEKVDSYLGSRPKDAQGRFLKGLILTEMNKPTDAIGVFSKLSEDYPELPEPYNNLAVLYAQQKQYDKARTALEMAIRTHPSYAIAYENLGDVYAKLASQAYDKALQLDGSNSATQNKLALIRDLITTSGRGNTKPTPVSEPVAAAPVTKPVAPAAPVAKPVTPPAPVAAAPVVAAPVPTAPPSATIVASTPGAAASTPAAAIEKPAEPKPAPAQKPHDNASADITKMVNAWANAWARKDMKAYLSAYASDFATPRGVSRKEWEQERDRRIAGKSGKISVDVDDLQISVNGDRATARFR